MHMQRCTFRFSLLRSVFLLWTKIFTRPDGGILHIMTSNSTNVSSPHDDKWFFEMSWFLNTSLPPPRMRTDEKKGLAVRSKNLCLVEDTQNHKGSEEFGGGVSATMRKTLC